MGIIICAEVRWEETISEVVAKATKRAECAANIKVGGHSGKENIDDAYSVIRREDVWPCQRVHQKGKYSIEGRQVVGASVRV